MKQTTSPAGKPMWIECTPDSPFSANDFYEVEDMGINDDGNTQYALHTSLGSITVLNRMTGFGYRDTETGFRDNDGKFWLASCHCDVRTSGAKTLGEAIDWVKKNANTCVGI